MTEMIKRLAKALKSAMQDSGVVSLVANGPNGEAALEQFFEVLAMDAIEATGILRGISLLHRRCPQQNGHREHDVSQFKYIEGVIYVTDEYLQEAMSNERSNAFWAGFIGGLFAMSLALLMWPL